MSVAMLKAKSGAAMSRADALRRQHKLSQLGDVYTAMLHTALLDFVADCHAAILYGVETQLRMGMTPLLEGHDIVLSKAGADRITSRLADWGCLNSRGISKISPLRLRMVNSAGQVMSISGSFTMDDPGTVAACKQYVGRMIREVSADLKYQVRGIVQKGLSEGRSVGELAYKIRDELNASPLPLTERQSQMVLNYRARLELDHNWEAVQQSRAAQSTYDAIAGGPLPSSPWNMTVPQLTAVHEAAWSANIIQQSERVNAMVDRYYAMKVRQRSFVIARTESLTALNEGSLASFAREGIQYAEVLANKDCCKACRDIDGKCVTLDEAKRMIPFHPSCRCTWLPRTERAPDTPKVEPTIQDDLVEPPPPPPPVLPYADKVAAVKNEMVTDPDKAIRYNLYNRSRAMDGARLRLADEEEQKRFMDAFAHQPPELLKWADAHPFELVVGDGRQLGKSIQGELIAIPDKKLTHWPDGRTNAEVDRHESQHQLIDDQILMANGGAPSVWERIKKLNAPRPLHVNSAFNARSRMSLLQQTRGAGTEWLSTCGDSYKTGMTREQFASALQEKSKVYGWNVAKGKKSMAGDGALQNRRAWTQEEAREVAGLWMELVKTGG